VNHRFRQYVQNADRGSALFAVTVVLLLGLVSTAAVLADPGSGDGSEAMVGPLSSVNIERSIFHWQDGEMLDRPDGERSVLAAASAPAAIPTPTYATQVTALTNAERSKVGMPPLKSADLLDGVALGHGTRMASADFFSHCDPGPPQTLPWDRMTAAGYIWSAAGENIAAGYPTPADVVAGWMSSSGHRANILSASFREMGSGYYLQADDKATVAILNSSCVTQTTQTGPYYRYWTQDFGSRPNVWPLVIAGEAFQTPALNVSLFIYTPTLPSQMRFSNDGVTWADWRPFTTTVAWALSPGNGIKTVYGQVYNGATTYVISDTIWLNAPPPIAPSVAISDVSPVTLSWQHQAVDLWYDVYRSGANPYFTPGGADAELVGAHVPAPASGSTIAFDDSASAPDQTCFYQVRAVAGDGQTTADSNRVGRFAFGLTPGH
jgi:uncharacterized protein YkwD